MTLLTTPLPEASASFAPLLQVGEHQLVALGAALLALGLAWFFACLRTSMGHASTARVLERVRDPQRRKLLAPRLERLSALADSASLFETACGILFALILVLLLAQSDELGWRDVLFALAISVPALYLATRGLAQAVALRFGDAWVATLLPAFHVVQLPLSGLVYVFRALRGGLLRALGLRDDDEEKREIVAGLSEVIADAAITGRLDATEREIIGNVMEFRDVDAAAVMTPRTEIRAVEVGDGVLQAARVAAETGHSRIPVYEGTLDSIIGTVSARELLGLLTHGEAEAADLRAMVHPAWFVPETKRVSEILADLRRENIKLAIVLDEYGGTAGLATIGDILEEIVGVIPDERGRTAPDPVQKLPGGVAEVDASMHVTEVNKALELEIPETADYETLGGFVLAELGRFPERGEGFIHEGTEFTVSDASDRRVLKVRVRRLAEAGV